MSKIIECTRCRVAYRTTDQLTLTCPNCGDVGRSYNPNKVEETQVQPLAEDKGYTFHIGDGQAIEVRFDVATGILHLQGTGELWINQPHPAMLQVQVVAVS